MNRLCAGLASLLMLGVLAAPALGKTQVAPQQLLVLVLTNHSVSRTPGGAHVVTVQATRPLGHGRTVLPVLARIADARGRIWLHVRMPGRTLGAVTPPATGWISATNTALRTTPWHIVVDLGLRRTIVYKSGHVLRTFPSIVGAPSTPTPTGQYFVEEDLSLSAGEVGGPFALATSDRSDVFTDFAGGPGQVAIHGLDNLGGQLGTAASHGCVRLADTAISWLAAHTGPGTPVTIG